MLLGIVPVSSQSDTMRVLYNHKHHPGSIVHYQHSRSGHSELVPQLTQASDAVRDGAGQRVAACIQIRQLPQVCNAVWYAAGELVLGDV